ncbi:uncharacterized protein LOC119092144 [Pollicipes pollicipes]|uniref:uncharacterized protein LOC119092144 n=1 Tax=Pollicipes pollicipes TaxID=41117 RepID=UPI001884BFD5|nr:uncharacterized protein LOC119092144 [Pollicipes pollicipes]
MSAAKRKVNPLTLKEKKAVILEVENSNGRTKSQIAEQFRIPKSTLSTILKEKERILNLNDADDLGPQRKRMRIRRGVHPQLEEALFAWLQEQAAANQTVSGQKMLARSQELAQQLGVDDFKNSVAWLEGFKRRHGLAGARPGPADGWRPEPAPDSTVPLGQLSALLDEYGAADVFVVAEMGVLFDLTPAEAGGEAVKACAAGELASRRLSVLAAASADGSQKLPLLVAGERPLPGASQPGRLAYRAEPRSWLQPDHFASWLELRDGELGAQGRRALFLCELQPLHATAGGGDARERAASPGEKRPRYGSPAGRRRPSSQEALKAVLVLQQYFQLRDGDDELDEVLSFVAFTKEKIVKLQTQEHRHDNGSQKVKKEPKVEKPDLLGTIKFESPILNIDPDVDPEELRDPSEVKPSTPTKPSLELLAPRKGGIRVGAQFQAEVPAAPLASPPDTSTDSSRLEEARWTPDHQLTEQQINQFVMLARAVGMFARACDAGSAASQPGIHVAAANASRDVTRAHALDVLHRHDYRLGAALTSLVPAGGPLLCRDELEDWSVHETAIFEEAVTRHGKQFDLVCRDYLPWKTSAQVNEYYYMWKTTDRYVRRRRAKHLARRQAAQVAAPSPREPASPPVAGDAAPPASPPPPPGRPGPASDALTLLSPMLNALGTSVSIEPVTPGSRRSPEQRGKAAAVEKLCGGVRLSGECSITPVPLSR